MSEHTGTVAFYMIPRESPDGWEGGYGYIYPDGGGQDLLFQRKGIAGNRNLPPHSMANKTIAKGQRVRYVVNGNFDKPRAEQVELFDGETQKKEKEDGAWYANSG